MGLGLIQLSAVVSGNKWKCAEKSVVIRQLIVDSNHEILVHSLQLFSLQVTSQYSEVYVLYMFKIH